MLRILTLSVLLVGLFFNNAPAGECHRVRYVIDGDTIILANGSRVRYLGINTPEIAHDEQSGEPLGDEAREANRNMTEGKQVYLEYGQKRKDHYGRHLALVYDCRTNQLINQELLQMGFGYLLSNGIEGPHIDRMLDAQRTAIQARKGIWLQLTRKQKPVDIFGNTRSMKFHRSGCSSGKLTSRSNHTALPSVLSAFRRGYAPCKVCLNDLFIDPLLMKQ